MPAKDLGNKHSCFKCGTRFYDLKKPAPVCPKCGADQRESPALKPPAVGEEVILRGKLRAPRAFNNPGAADRAGTWPRTRFSGSSACARRTTW